MPQTLAGDIPFLHLLWPELLQALDGNALKTASQKPTCALEADMPHLNPGPHKPRDTAHAA